jgi:hypothetical protein
VSQRAFVDHSANPLTHALEHGPHNVYRQLLEFLFLYDFRKNYCRFNQLIVVSKFRRLFSETLAGVFRGMLSTSISTIHDVTFQFLPFLCVLSSSVSVISDMRIQCFSLWSTLSKEALKIICSLRPSGRNFLEKLRLILLDRNHFLVLVNGRSPP